MIYFLSITVLATCNFTNIFISNCNWNISYISPNSYRSINEGPWILTRRWTKLHKLDISGGHLHWIRKPHLFSTPEHSACPGNHNPMETKVLELLTKCFRSIYFGVFVHGILWLTVLFLFGIFCSEFHLQDSHTQLWLSGMGAYGWFNIGDLGSIQLRSISNKAAEQSSWAFWWLRYSSLGYSSRITAL